MNHSPNRRRRSTTRTKNQPTADIASGTVRKRYRWLPRTGGTTISITFHILLLLWLAPYFVGPEIPTQQTKPIVVQLWRPPKPPAPEPPQQKPVETELVAEPAAEGPPQEVEDATDETPPVDNTPDIIEVTPSSIVPFGLVGTGRPTPIGRRSTGRSGAMGAFGGTGATEDVVSAGLRWLADHQEKRGYWDPYRFTQHCDDKSCAGTGNKNHRSGVTALALLAFLGAGYDGTGEYEYDEVVQRGLDYLVARQTKWGSFGGMYSHGISTYCLAEAASFTGRKEYREAVHRALRYLERAQQAGGGWDYSMMKTNRNDMSITGWQVMAIHTAKGIGLDVEERNLERLDDYLATCRGRYANKKPVRASIGVGTKSAWLLARLTRGTPIEQIRKEAKFLLRRPPIYKARRKTQQYERGWKSFFESTYYYYYGTLLSFHLGGEYWESWNASLIKNVIPHQCKEGHARGSWAPSPTWVGRAGGRVASTAIMVMVFESYYRFVPTHEKRRDPKTLDRR